MDHNMKMESWKEVGNRIKFRGVCSCGEKSDPLTTAGMVAQWQADHVNRQPQLTKAIVVAAAQACAARRAGKRVLTLATLRDARVMSQQLRVLLGEPPYREAEQLALDLFERARAFIEDGTPLPEEGPGAPSSHLRVL